MMRQILLLTAALAVGMASQAVPFTLHNGSAKSISLEIPSVMNPNLSPFSDSAVDLKVGQKIYFKYNKKRYVLLEVTEDLTGKTLEVDELLKARKLEIDRLKK